MDGSGHLSVRIPGTDTFLINPRFAGALADVEDICTVDIKECKRLEGIGPIPVSRARELCGGDTSWMRVLTHPETGMVLSVGRDLYRAAGAAQEAQAGASRQGSPLQPRLPP